MEWCTLIIMIVSGDNNPVGRKKRVGRLRRLDENRNAVGIGNTSHFLQRRVIIPRYSLSCNFRGCDSIANISRFLVYLLPHCKSVYIFIRLQPLLVANIATVGIEHVAFRVIYERQNV